MVEFGVELTLSAFVVNAIKDQAHHSRGTDALSPSAHSEVDCGVVLAN